MTKKDSTILIDRYLSREMAQEEKSGFERLLSESDSSYNGEPTLRKEMNLQQLIEKTVRERGLREMLQKEEARIRCRQKIWHVAMWSLGGGSVISALAAAVLLLLVISPLAHQMQDYSTQYVAQVEVGIVRGDNVMAEKLDNALVLMQNNDWDSATAIVDEVFEQTEGSRDEQIRELHAHAQWLKALCLMHSGKVLKAKRLLRQIANSDSPYNSEAAKLIESF